MNNWRGRGYVVVTRCCFYNFYGILYVLMITKLNSPFVHAPIMPVADFHAWMMSHSGSASLWISLPAFVVTSTTLSDLNGIVMCLAMRKGSEKLCASPDTVMFLTMSSSCSSCFRLLLSWLLCILLIPTRSFKAQSFAPVEISLWKMCPWWMFPVKSVPPDFVQHEIPLGRGRLPMRREVKRFWQCWFSG